MNKYKLRRDKTHTARRLGQWKLICSDQSQVLEFSFSSSACKRTVWQQSPWHLPQTFSVLSFWLQINSVGKNLKRQLEKESKLNKSMPGVDGKPPTRYSMLKKITIKWWDDEFFIREEMLELRQRALNRLEEEGMSLFNPADVERLRNEDRYVER